MPSLANGALVYNLAARPVYCVVGFPFHGSFVRWIKAQPTLSAANLTSLKDM